MGRFLSDHFLQRLKPGNAKGAGQSQEWLLAWRITVTSTKVPRVTIFPGQCVLQGKAKNLYRRLKNPVHPVILVPSPIPASDSGRPLASFPVPGQGGSKPWTPRVYINKVVARGGRLLPARGCLVPAACCLCTLSQ